MVGGSGMERTELSSACLFLFRRRPAYGWLRGLVGSEMCIRGSLRGTGHGGAGRPHGPGLHVALEGEAEETLQALPPNRPPPGARPRRARGPARLSLRHM